MALEGTIKEFGLADIFQLIALQKKTGVLFLKGTDGTVNIHFEDGMVVKAETSQRKSKHQIGRIFINRGKINEPQLKDALEIQVSTGQKVGQVLLGQGLINKDDLRDALAFQMSEIVYRVFRWKGGDYKFYQDKVDYDRDTVQPLNSENILMDGVRMLDEWPRIEKKLPSIEVVLKKADAAKKDAGNDEDGVDIFAGGGKHGSGGMSKEASSIIELIDGRKSIYEILEYSSYGEFDTYKAIVDLIDMGAVLRTGAKPGIMREDAQVAAPTFRREPVNIDKLPYVFLAVSVVLLCLQLTGTRKITSTRATGLEALKSAFAVEQVESFYDNALLYYFDSGSYPETGIDMVKRDYMSKSSVLDPWGGQLVIIATKSGNLVVNSPGPDKTMGTADDISSNP